MMNEGQSTSNSTSTVNDAGDAKSGSARNPRVLLGVTGSVASIKTVPLHGLLVGAGYDVKVVTTEHAEHFFTANDAMFVVRDADEWSSWSNIGDPVLHIELRKWADVMVIAPLSANSLAKLANGMSDNLLTCTVRAWDFNHDPILAAPAMNTLMWDNPFTKRHLDVLEEVGFGIIMPVAKKLACGDVGVGAMAHIDTIVQRVSSALLSRQK